ncbi:hypothetical protein M8J77_024477 [Diaphorina citri]|nr:hypothetical protein M8J77_024477 [Diaphorina citri]
MIEKKRRERKNNKKDKKKKDKKKKEKKTKKKSVKEEDIEEEWRRRKMTKASPKLTTTSSYLKPNLLNFRKNQTMYAICQIPIRPGLS